MSAAEGLAPAAPAPAKKDPESLALRARPRPAVRFRRGLIIGAAGVVAACLIVVTWAALEPPSFRRVAEGGQGELQARATPDTLAKAPASYGDVPSLGPPLPGDLGRPILEHRRSLESEGEAEGAGGEMERARAAAEAERQRLAAAEQAARASGVIVQLSGGERSDGDAPAAPVPPAPTQPSPTPALPEPSRGWEGRSAPQPAVNAYSDALVEASSPWTLTAGTVIPASLVTGLNSDLPGLVMAQVTEHVRDSATGRAVLIPQGSRLVGSYDSVVAYGQRRALLVWQRIVLPDGSSVRLDNVPATDAQGYAGVEDRVDFHSWRLLKGIALSTLLGVGTELGLGSGESDLVRAIRESTQQNAARAGDRMTERNLDVKPTLTVRPGSPLRAVIHKDIVLRPWRG